jgi:hypothetical protein
MVERRENQRFEDHLCPRPQGTSLIFFTAQPFDPADSPKELHHTQSPGKQQISYITLFIKDMSRPFNER